MMFGMVSVPISHSRSVVMGTFRNYEDERGGGDVDAKIRNPGILRAFWENQS